MASSCDIGMRLDLCIAMVLGYLLPNEDSKSNFLGELLQDENFKWILKTSNDVDKFKMLLRGFDEHVVSAFNVHSVSFLWFYLSSISEENSKKMLECLWQCLVIARSPNEWKKSQHAVAFLGGFLAHANYISLSTAHSYLKNMLKFCLAYLDNLDAKSTKKSVSCVQHGLFYATVQSILYVLCYRWKEFDEIEDLKCYIQKKLVKILKSHLNPLRCVSRVVVQYFDKVNRRLKIIENTLVQEANGNFVVVAAELYFPFSLNTMKMCSSIFLPLQRRFIPCEKRRKKSSATICSRSEDPEKKIRREH
uniref:Uncharacterized protein n=1 Tax=Ditylenchus dipsaci TaxID=166011 RepID=A0A915DH92_9BILA